MRRLNTDLAEKIVPKTTSDQEVKSTRICVPPTQIWYTGPLILHNAMLSIRKLSQYWLTGLLLLVPAWGTFLVLSKLFQTLDEVLADLFGPRMQSDIPGLGILVLAGLILFIGMVANHVLGQHAVRWAEHWLERIPIVRTVFLTLKGMTDLFNFRSRFGRSTVVVFPFPRDGLWALGLVMGAAPAPLQVVSVTELLMVFVPTAIHPFTGYLAFVPKEQVRPINLPAEEAMKLEFSAGLYRPIRGWLASPKQDMPR